MLNLEQIQAIAKQSFVSGLDIRRQFFAEWPLSETDYAKLKISLVMSYDEYKSVAKSSMFKNIVKADFPYTAMAEYGKTSNKGCDRDPSEIPDALYVAASGPKSSNDFSHIFETMIFHPTRPIFQIYALGDDLSTYKESADFYNYFYEKDYTVNDQYKVSCKNLMGEYRNYAAQSIRLMSIIEANFTVEDLKTQEKRSFSITALPVEDMHPIESTPENLRVVIKLAESKEPSLVHCTSGVGRTGNLILAAEIYKNAKSIFEDAKNEADAAVEINKILNRIRTNRPCLVANEAQFLSAIQLGFDAYLLKKELTKESDQGQHSIKTALTQGLMLLSPSTKEKEAEVLVSEEKMNVIKIG